MDQKQILRFVLVASVAFLAMTLLQPIFFPAPQKPQVPEKPPAGEVAEKTDADPQNPAQADDAAPVAAEPLSYPDSQPNRLVALGGFGNDRAEKLLVTLDSRGGAIRRIELNARLANGNLRYRDQETRGAYVGHLDVTPHPRGCEIHFVGAGTPAARAGLQVGDILTAIDGEPLVLPEDLARRIEQTRVDQTLELKYLRGGESAAEATCSVTAVQKPLEVIGPAAPPESERFLDLTTKTRSSFLISLRKKVFEQAVWPELDPQMTSVNWATREYTADGTPVVEFSHEIPANMLAAHQVAGPVRIIKRYWLPEPTALDDFEKNYHVNFEIEIQNLSDQPFSAALDVLGPTGANIEGWWYQSKIHGRSSAIGHTAGARDIVAGSLSNGFEFWGNAEVVQNFLSRQPTYQALISPSATGNSLNFIVVDTLYFAIGMIPDGELRAPGTESAASAAVPFVPYSAFPHVVDFPRSLRENRSLRRTTDLTFHLFSDEVSVPAKSTENAEPASIRQAFVLFAGPKEPQLLARYRVAPTNNIEEVVTYGWFAAFSKPLVLLLRFFYSLVHNYGLAIIMLTVIVRLLLMPISRKVAMNAQQSSKMMQTLQPEIKRLSEKYKDDLEKRMRAQQELFAKHGFNPIKQQFGGCLMVFLQLPIFIGLYRGLSVDVALRGQPLIPGLSWCSDLAAPDKLLYWREWMPGFLASETSWFGPYLNLLPLITIVLFLVQTKMFMPPPTDDQQRIAQRMMTFMMVFMSVLFFKVPSGLCLYFITSSIWGMVERSFLPKPKMASTDATPNTIENNASGRSAPRLSKR